MENVVVDENIESGIWPNEFNNGWLNIFIDIVSGDTVLCLYFNNDFPYETVHESEERPIILPDSYVSWDRDGNCIEVFVKPELRRRGVGTALCAYARSYALSKGIIFSAPHKMSLNAKMMYESICNKYGETYLDPEELGSTLAYGYWGARFID